MGGTLQIESHEFREADLIGGHPAIDFVNTVTGWDVRPRDWILDYAALVDWALFSGLLGRMEADRLRDLAASSPRRAAVALKEAKTLRAALHGLLTARIDGTPPRANDLEVIRRMWQKLCRHSELVIDSASGIGTREVEAGLALVSMRVLDAFVRLGEDFASPRLKRCAGVNCGWFFLDRSKPGRRRWCDMATCGNADKNARHHGKRSSRK